MSPDGTEVYISGFFKDSVDFDPGPDTHILEMIGSIYDHFVLKLDGDGNFQWVHNVPAAMPNLVSTVRIDLEGNVLFTGIFEETFDFDPAPGIGDTLFLDADASYATFFQKVDTDGNLIWATRVSNIIANDAYVDEDLNT